MTPDRHLVACDACGLQYDASGRPAGSRFRCRCGEAITIAPLQPHEAAVVRCSSCGAPRGSQALTCGFCQADFTLHEQDLRTICPGCMTRISDRSRFCHSCGLPIAPQGAPGAATELECPACGAGHALVSRALADERLTLLECQRCAGLWAGKEAFSILEERARATAAPLDLRAAATSTAAVTAPGDGPLYRPCVQCGKLMHRRNYGRKSRVIVDTCAEHGIWFDCGELDAALRWLREGGQHALDKELERERRELEKRQRIERVSELTLPPVAREVGPGSSLVTLVRGLFELLAR